MTRKQFVTKFTNFLRYGAVRLSAESFRHGHAAIESEIYDIDDLFFQKGLCLVVDGCDPKIIDEILTNDLAFIKGKYKLRYMTIVKRTVLAIQERLGTRFLVMVLLSLAGLTLKERREIENEFLKDYNEPEEKLDVNEEEIIEQFDYTTNKRQFYMVIEDIEYSTGEKNPKGVIFGNDSDRRIIITKDCPDPERIKK